MAQRKKVFLISLALLVLGAWFIIPTGIPINVGMTEAQVDEVLGTKADRVWATVEDGVIDREFVAGHEEDVSDWLAKHTQGQMKRGKQWTCYRVAFDENGLVTEVTTLPSNESTSFWQRILKRLGW